MGALGLLSQVLTTGRNDRTGSPHDSHVNTGSPQKNSGLTISNWISEHLDMFTTKQKLKAVITWASMTRNPNVHLHKLFALAKAFERFQSLTVGQQIELDSIIKEYNIQIAHFMD